MASDDAAAEVQEEHAQQELGGKKPPGTWTPMETLHLIDAYQEKWYALKRGQLRTCHWDEVAESLAGRCAGHPEATDKSSVQCRHKLEKLRRKYRAERQLFLRKAPGHASSLWPFFERMDLLERGPVAAAEAAAAAAAAKAALPFADLKFGNTRELQDHDSAMSLDEDPEDSDQPPPTVFSNRKRRHHHHNPHQDTLYDDNDGSYSPFSRKHGIYEMPSSTAFNKRDDHKHLKFSEKMGPRRHTEAGPFVELVSVIRSLGEGFLRMEQMKLQVQRETERFRAEMEMRRTEMFIDSQKQIADLFTKALVSSKKSKESLPPPT
ncbi:hypothetical protein L7F22_003441 [Adiantum nelumboides]|nr:hypothetical protein [Adiantum nelumboides]